MVAPEGAAPHANLCLAARDLWFAYQDGPPVLQGVSLSIASGDFVAFIGQNGSGKTTLAKHFNGLLRPWRGQVSLFGEDISGRSVSDLAHSVGYIFQNPDHQIFSDTTRDEIAFGPRNLGLQDAEVQERTEEAINLFRLSAYADIQPAVLGFGLRRKVSLAAVYAMRPQIMILDEPTAGLDWRSIHETMGLMLALNQQGHTILLITHDMRVVAEYSTRCMVLKGGRLIASDETRAIFAQADLLRETEIEPPQIAELARRLAADGVERDVLTVDEFCLSYCRLLGQEGGADASHG